MWRFIHSQLRHWREYWSEQSAKRRVPAAPRLAARLTKRESGECGSAWGRWAPPGPWTRPAAPPPQRGLLGSCRGLTGTWLGPDGLLRGQGQAGEAGALVATEGRAAVGWGALAGSMPSGWPWGPHQGRPRVLTCPLALHLGLAVSQDAGSASLQG